MAIDPEVEAYLDSTDELASSIRTMSDSIRQNVTALRAILDDESEPEPEPEPEPATPTVRSFTATAEPGAMVFAYELAGDFTQLDMIGIGVGTNTRFITWEEQSPAGSGGLRVTGLTAGDGTCGADIQFRFKSDLGSWVHQAHVEAAVIPPSPSGGGGGGTPTPTPTGFFTAVNGEFRDPEGKIFVPRGANVAGGDNTWNFWDAVSPGSWDRWNMFTSDPWHSNCFRIMHTERQDLMHHPHWANYEPLDDLIARATAARVVLILANLDNTPGWTSLNQTYVSHAIEKMGRLALRYKDNPYVWFEPFNEPTESDVGGSGNIDFWMQWNRPVVAAIRSEAPHSMIVLPGDHYGQDRSENSGIPVLQDGILHRGAVTRLRDEFGGPFCASPHMYLRWRNSLASDNDLLAYHKAMLDQNIPIVWGEVGQGYDIEHQSPGAYLEGPSRLYRVLNQQTQIGALMWRQNYHDTEALHFQWVANLRAMGR